MRRDFSRLFGPPTAFSVERQRAVSVYLDPLVCPHGQGVMRTEREPVLCCFGRVAVERECRPEDSRLQLVLSSRTCSSWRSNVWLALDISGMTSGVLTTPCRFDVPFNQQLQCRNADAHGNL